MKSYSPEEGSYDIEMLNNQLGYCSEPVLDLLGYCREPVLDLHKHSSKEDVKSYAKSDTGNLLNLYNNFKIKEDVNEN